MLCNLFEDTRVKCDQYWPDVIGKKIIYGNEIEVELVNKEDILGGLIVKRDLCVQPYHHEEDPQLDISSNGISENSEVVVIKGDKHYVTQFHVVCWPDHSVPDNKYSFQLFDFITNTIYNNYQFCLKNNIKNSPTIVHCSAGIGRTGTMISIYNVFDHLKRQVNTMMSINNNDCSNNINNNTDEEVISNIDKYPSAHEDDNYPFEAVNQNRNANKKTNIFFSVFCLVRKLREQRFGFVTDLSQYKAIYKFTYNWIRHYYFGKDTKQIIEQLDNQIESPMNSGKQKPYINKGDLIIRKMNFCENKSISNNNIPSVNLYKGITENNNHTVDNVDKDGIKRNNNKYNDNNNKEEYNDYNDTNIKDFKMKSKKGGKSVNFSNIKPSLHNNDEEDNDYDVSNSRNTNINTVNKNENNEFSDDDKNQSKEHLVIPSTTKNYNVGICFTSTNRHKKKNISFTNTLKTDKESLHLIKDEDENENSNLNSNTVNIEVNNLNEESEKAKNRSSNDLINTPKENLLKTFTSTALLNTPNIKDFALSSNNETDEYAYDNNIDDSNNMSKYKNNNIISLKTKLDKLNFNDAELSNEEEDQEYKEK